MLNRSAKEPSRATSVPQGLDATTREVVFAMGFLTWADMMKHDMSWSADRMVQGLLDDPTVSRVLVVDPPRSWLSILRRHEFGRHERFPAGERAHLIHPLRLSRHDPVHVDEASGRYRRLDRRLRRRADAQGMTRPVLVTTHPVLAAHASREHWSDIVYYGWDDWASYRPFSQYWDLFTVAYRRMAENDVQVLAVSQHIVDRISARRSTVIPNAVDVSDFRTDAHPPAWFARIEGPIALYTGTLEGRVDVGAIHCAATRLTDWTFVLVGHLAEPAHFASLRALPNVIVEERHPRTAVLSMMKHATVGLIPHVSTPLTNAMSPLKLYEYLAAGAPVVATDLLPIRGVSPFCTLVPPGDSRWDVAIRAAASKPRATAEEVGAWVEGNSWEVRYRQWNERVFEDSMTAS